MHQKIYWKSSDGREAYAANVDKRDLLRPEYQNGAAYALVPFQPIAYPDSTEMGRMPMHNANSALLAVEVMPFRWALVGIVPTDEPLKASLQKPISKPDPNGDPAPTFEQQAKTIVQNWSSIFEPHLTTRLENTDTLLFVANRNKEKVSGPGQFDIEVRAPKHSLLTPDAIALVRNQLAETSPGAASNLGTAEAVWKICEAYEIPFNGIVRQPSPGNSQAAPQVFHTSGIVDEHDRYKAHVSSNQPEQKTVGSGLIDAFRTYVLGQPDNGKPVTPPMYQLAQTQMEQISGYETRTFFVQSAGGSELSYQHMRPEDMTGGKPAAQEVRQPILTRSDQPESAYKPADMEDQHDFEEDGPSFR